MNQFVNQSKNLGHFKAFVALNHENIYFLTKLELTRLFTCPGSGKTYTMKPLPLKASRDILRLMHHTYRNHGFQLFVSFFEIYGGKLFDLLNDRKYVVFPSHFYVSNTHELHLVHPKERYGGYYISSFYFWIFVFKDRGNEWIMVLKEKKEN